MSDMVLCEIYFRGIYFMYFSIIWQVGLFAPDQNNNRCPGAGALLVFEDILEIKERLIVKSMIPMSKAIPAFCLPDTSLRDTAYASI